MTVVVKFVFWFQSQGVDEADIVNDCVLKGIRLDVFVLL